MKNKFWMGILWSINAVAHVVQCKGLVIDGSIRVNSTDGTDADNGVLGPLHGPHVDFGSSITFSFELTVSGAEQVRQFLIFVNGSGLEFTPGKSLSIYAKTAPVAMPVDDLEKPTTQYGPDLGEIIFNNNGLPVALVTGKFTMQLKEKPLTMASHQAFVTVVPIELQTNLSLPAHRFSSAVISPHVATFSLGHPSPTFVGIRNTTKVNLNVTFEDYITGNSYVKMYLPFNDKYDEPKMVGTSLDMWDIYDVESSKRSLKSRSQRFSATGTSETTSLSMPFPKILNDQPFTVSVMGEAMLLDFQDMEQNEVSPINFGVKIDEDAIWVGQTHVQLINDNTITNDTLPDLRVTMHHMHTHVKKDVIHYRLSMVFSLPDFVMTSAYNLSATVYLPPQVEFAGDVRYNDIIRPVESLTKNKFVRFEVERISIPLRSRIAFNVTVDTKSPNFKGGEPIPLIYESSYVGWRSKDILYSALDVLDLMPPPEFEPNHVEQTEEPCTCPDDLGNDACICCKNGKCPCPKDNTRCEDCKKLWKCSPILPEFWIHSYLSTSQGYIQCSGYDQSDNSSPQTPRTSCFWMSPSSVYKPLGDAVSTVLGMDTSANFLYGISHTGLGYVISVDEGMRWTSITNDQYKMAMKGEHFKNSSFVFNV